MFKQCRIIFFLLSVAAVYSFSSSRGIMRLSPEISSTSFTSNVRRSFIQTPKKAILLMNANNDDSAVLNLSESDQTVLGAVGSVMSIVMMYSEYVLKTTGCGLPAGPFGLVGAVEGLSYLGVTGLIAFSVFTKVKTGSGLPAGPYGLVGLAEGLSFLAIFAGLIVLVLQVTNFGYIPNAIPMDGGMCQ